MRRKQLHRLMSLLVRRLHQMKLLKLSVLLFLFAICNGRSKALNVLQTAQCPVLLKLKSREIYFPSTKWRDQPKEKEKNKQKSESLKLTCIIVVIQNSFLLESLQLQHHGLNLRKTQRSVLSNSLKINVAQPPKKSGVQRPSDQPFRVTTGII